MTSEDFLNKWSVKDSSSNLKEFSHDFFLFLKGGGAKQRKASTSHQRQPKPKRKASPTKKKPAKISREELIAFMREVNFLSEMKGEYSMMPSWILKKLRTRFNYSDKYSDSDLSISMRGFANRNREAILDLTVKF